MDKAQELAKRLAESGPGKRDPLHYKYLTPEERERLVPSEAEQIEVVSGGKSTPEK